MDEKIQITGLSRMLSSAGSVSCWTEQLFSRNTIGSFIKVLSYQLERNAEKVEEKKPESLIDVRA